MYNKDMKTTTLPSQEYLKECFEYDMEKGVLIWKHRPLNHFSTEQSWKSCNTRFANKPALNSLNGRNYRHGKLDGVPLLAHRVIYKLIYGDDPDSTLHSYGNTANNKLESISSGTQEENLKDKKKYKNNVSGVNGVSWDKKPGKWKAYIGVNGRPKHLGYFDKLEEAVSVRKAAEIEYGYHAEHGKR